MSAWCCRNRNIFLRIWEFKIFIKWRGNTRSFNLCHFRSFLWSCSMVFSLSYWYREGLWYCGLADGRALFRGTFYCMLQDKCINEKIRLISTGSPSECIGGCRMVFDCEVDSRVSILRSALVNAINFTVYESLRKEIALWDPESIGR
jgi:hypothetical protein